jgi:membrane protein implicated in regulation of membrane protease activity
MVWWAWVLVGFLMLLGELLTPGGFFILFFGVGALVVGALGALGIELSPAVQWLLFTAVSIAALALFRRPLLARLGPGKVPGSPPDVIGETAVAIDSIAPGEIGQVELRGTPWRARNVSTRALVVGERCRVLRVDGLTVELTPEHA